MNSPADDSGELTAMDFREVTDNLHGSVLHSHSIDLARHRVELAMPGLTVVFESVSLLKWTAAPSGSDVIRVRVIGLERLGSGEPWRFYLEGENAGELELTCARVICGEDEVTGIGRSYRH